MTPDATRLLDEALKLPAKERAAVARHLLRSLEGEDDDLDDEERDRLHAALAASEEDVAAGNVRDAGDVIAELRQQRK